MWEAILDATFAIIQFFFDFVKDWGMAIVVVTIIFRLLITPLMYKTAKSNYQMQKVQPLMKQIQERFADDPVRQNQEMQKLYAEAKFNPLAGCLPMFLQMPIFIALFQVLRDMGNRAEGTLSFYNLVPDLAMTPGQALAAGFGAFIPYLILMVVFAGATFLPMILMQRNNSDTAQKKQMYIMSGVMSLFMLWISWGSPAGVLLFWGVSSLIAIAQQQISLRVVKKKEAVVEAEKALEVRPIEVDVTRKAKKKRPHKSR